jgi:uncharacterized cupredoxin-like copper-binding protein
MAIPSVVAILVAALLTLGTASAGAVAQSERAADNRATPASALTAPGPTASGPVRPAQAERRVEVTMKEMVFLPDRIDVLVGETVTFVFTNSGRAVHEAFIGDKAAQDEHARQMREDGPGHQHEHHGGVTVQPGQTGALRYTFVQPGTLEIGCHQPNHYESGMKAIINAD